MDLLSRIDITIRRAWRYQKGHKSP